MSTQNNTAQNASDLFETEAMVQAAQAGQTAANSASESSLESSVETAQTIPSNLDSADLTIALAIAMDKVKSLEDAALRARAEADNARRRAADDVSKAHKFALEGFAEALVPVKDTLELAIADATADSAKVREGVAATVRMLAAAFEKNGIADINPAAGEKFDPHLHQSIAMIPSEHPVNTVVGVMQKGAKIYTRLIRPAMVTISTGTPAA